MPLLNSQRITALITRVLKEAQYNSQTLKHSAILRLVQTSQCKKVKLSRKPLNVCEQNSKQGKSGRNNRRKRNPKLANRQQRLKFQNPFHLKHHRQETKLFPPPHLKKKGRGGGGE